MRFFFSLERSHRLCLRLLHVTIICVLFWILSFRASWNSWTLYPLFVRVSCYLQKLLITLLTIVMCCFHSEEQSRLAARKYARVIQKLGFPVSILHLYLTVAPCAQLLNSWQLEICISHRTLGFIYNGKFSYLLQFVTKDLDNGSFMPFLIHFVIYE